MFFENLNGIVNGIGNGIAKSITKILSFKECFHKNLL
jgi:hypothetical protein